MLVLIRIMSICCIRSIFLLHSSQRVDGSSLSFTWPGKCGMRCSRQASPMIKQRLCCWIWPRPRMTLHPWKVTCCLLRRERLLSNKQRAELWVSILAAASTMYWTLYAWPSWQRGHSSVKRTSQTSREFSTPNTSGYFGCKLLLGFFSSPPSFLGFASVLLRMSAILLRMSWELHGRSSLCSGSEQTAWGVGPTRPFVRSSSSASLPEECPLKLFPVSESTLSLLPGVWSFPIRPQQRPQQRFERDCSVDGYNGCNA